MERLLRAERLPGDRLAVAGRRRLRPLRPRPPRRLRRRGRRGRCPRSSPATHGVYCGDSTRRADCTRTWRFTRTRPRSRRSTRAAAARQAAPAPRRRPPTERRRCRPAGPSAGCRGRARSPSASAPARIATLAGFCLADQPFLAVTFHERPAADTVRLGFAFSQGALEAEAGYEETAGGAFVVALADSPLARRLGGRDTEVAVTVDGKAEGSLSLAGSTKALRGALEACHGF